MTAFYIFYTVFQVKSVKYYYFSVSHPLCLCLRYTLSLGTAKLFRLRSFYPPHLNNNTNNLLSCYIIYYIMRTGLHKARGEQTKTHTVVVEHIKIGSTYIVRFAFPSTDTII